ncbi:MAG: ATP synthase F0 subunit A [Deltaproteobacteria bacterium]|nr:MAG: ATP synthase F0 subunit A [Deltaproteobacteria bacterium]
MEHPILFINLLLDLFHLPVHGGPGLLPKIIAPHVTNAWFVMIFLIISAKLFVGKIQMIPGKGQNFFEAVVSGIEGFAAENMGEEGARLMLPMIATLGIYIFIANLIGLFPGFMSPTANVNTTISLAIIVFITTHILGVKFHGVKYIKHFMGPIIWLAPLMFLIELIGHFARILSLSIRLFGNIMAKEVLLGLLFLLSGAFLGPLPIMALGVFVCFVQAFVFVLLSILYFTGAMEHAH